MSVRVGQTFSNTWHFFFFFFVVYLAHRIAGDPAGHCASPGAVLRSGVFGCGLRLPGRDVPPMEHCGGYKPVWVKATRIGVDLDLAKFFDNVQHDVLLARVGRKVRDKRLLALVGKYLRAGVLVGGDPSGDGDWNAAGRATVSTARQHSVGRPGQGTGTPGAPVRPLRGRPCATKAHWRAQALPCSHAARWGSHCILEYPRHFLRRRALLGHTHNFLWSRHCRKLKELPPIS